MEKNTRSHMLVVALVAVLLATAGAARAADIGANDDTGKFAEDGGSAFFERMAALGLRQTVMTVHFRPDEPETIQGRDFLDKAVPEATRQGLKVVLAVYPYPPRALARTRAEAAAFARYVALVAREYPQVRQFVIGNEPNQPAFWRPQLSRSGVVLSAPDFGRYLSAAYDALKQLDEGIAVIGIGLSARGNDNPGARSNRSTSPVSFLGALGAWYRKSGRRAPLMDGLSFHVYPRVATETLLHRHDWPNAGFADLERIKQAFWDAFHGSSQPTTTNGLRLYLNEAGWQVGTAGIDGYVGRENVPVTTEQKQAAIYAELVRRVACDGDIAEVNFFGFYDDAARDSGFQAGLHRLNGTARPAALSVAGAIRRTTDRGCARRLTWTPAKTVSGAGMSKPKLQHSGAVRTLVGAKEGARAVVCLVPSGSRARELASTSSLLRRAVGHCWQGRLTPRFRIAVKLDVPEAVRGRVLVAARISAEANPSRGSSFIAAPTGP
jgi:hypothetical protein